MDLQLPVRSSGNPVAPLRRDDWLRRLAKGLPARHLPPPHPLGPQARPDPPFPRRPDLLGRAADDAVVLERHWTGPLVCKVVPPCW